MAVAAPSPTPVQEDFRSAYADLQPPEEDFKAAYSDLAEPDFTAAYADIGNPDTPDSAQALKDVTPSTFGPSRVEAAQIALTANKENLHDFAPFAKLPRAGQQEGVAKEVAAGLYNTAANIIEPIESPAGMNIAALSTIPGAGRALAGGIGWEMLKDIPDAYKALQDAEGVQQNVEAGGRLAADVVFGGLGIGGAVRPGKFAAEQPKTGEPNAVQIGSAEAQISRPIETGEIKPADSGGMGQEQLRTEVARPQDEVPPATEAAGAGPVAIIEPKQVTRYTPAAIAARTLYHGSYEKLEGPLRSGLGKNKARFLHEEGIWFAPNRGKNFDSSWISDAIRYSGDEGTIVSANLNLKNPYYGSVDDIVSNKINAKWLKDNGYDGFVDDVTGSGMVVVLEHSQIAELGRENLRSQQPPPAEPAAGAIEEPPQTPTGLKNSIVDQDRIKMGLPERMKPARATNQTAWDAAMARVDKNPVAGTELVKELKGKPRALNPEDTALLLHEKLTRETNFDRAVEDVNNAKNETDLTRAKSDLAIARDAFHEIADVSQNQAGRESGLSLQARKMLVNRDFSLARMEAEERASANDGKPLSESQLADVKAAHEKIAELEAKIREHESEAQNQELKRYFDKLLKEAKPKAGGRVVDFLHEQRDKARAREKARVGRLSAGIDPAQLADQVIIGASHIADGLIEIGAWSTKMLSDFGEAIRPFLKDIFDKSRALHDAAAKKFQNKEKKTPATKEESTLKRVKTGYINRTRELQGKIASDQLERPIRTKTQLDHEGEKLKGEYERLKEHWLTRQAANEAKNKTASQKFWDHFVGVQRAMKLSSDAVLAKLTLAAVAREAVLTPAEEAVGGVLSKAMPRLAKRAPREGGFSLNAEVKAKVDTFTKGMRDSWQNLKMQKSDLEAIYGKKEFTPQQWYQYFGYLHGALKAPVKRAEFTRSMAKRMKWAIQEGKDINNPNVIGELAQEAYVDANRSIFMQNNIISTAISTGLKAAERSKIAPNIGPGIARLGNFLMPIIKVPTNIVGEVATGVHGVVTGSLRAGFAYLKGIESLPIEQGDAIMRQLKKGAIGNALLLTGYFGYESIGGFYHQGDKRSDNDVPAGRFRIGDVDLPKSASHSTGAMLLEIGATVHRIQDERLHKGDSGAVATGKGVLVAGQGLTHELPFVPAVTGISDAIGTQYGFEKYINSMITGSTSPAIVSHVARVIDTPGSFPKNILVEPTKRKPTNVWQSLEMGFPGLRQRVPEKSNGAKISGSPFKGSSMRGSKQP